MDGAGSYSVAHRAGLLPTELTDMWGWILLNPLTRAGGQPQPLPPCPWASETAWVFHMIRDRAAQPSRT